MALVVKDRVKETTTTTGTGTYTLGGAVTGFETFTANLSDSDTTYYACTDGTNFEVGIGTFTSSGTTLARTNILASSNSNNEVNWSSGSREIFITYPADKAVIKDASGHVSLAGNLDVDGTTNLDAIDIDGNVQLDGTLTVGVDDTGKDVKLFGATSGAYLLWDESADKLLTAGGAVVDIVKDKLLIGGTAVTTTAAELNILDGKAFLDEDDMSTNSATGIASQQSIKAYVDAQQSMGSGFVLEDDDGTEVTVTEDKEVKIIGSGVTTNWTDTSTGSDGDPYDLTITVDAAQTGITSLLATDIKIGEDDQTKIDFETADEIHFYAANVEQVYLADNIFGPQSDSDVDLGTTGVRWKDAFVDSVTVTDNVTIGGNLTVNGTTTTIDTTNTVVKDSLLGLNNGASSNSNDSGIIIERGSTGNDALLIWDESADKWALGTTTSNASSTGNLNMTTGTLVANVEGNVTGNLTGTASLATTVTITDNESTDEDNAVVFTAGGDVDGGNLGLESDGNLTYNPSTGRLTATQLSGTLQTAAQANVTSLGTLTTLTVDNVIINGSTIGHATDDTDLMTVADGVLTVAGEVSMTTLDIGGTNVTATAAELNYVDGVTSAIQTQMDTKTTPGFALAMAICL